MNDESEVMDISISIPNEVLSTEISEDSASVENSTYSKPSPEFKIANKNNSINRGKRIIGQRITDIN